MPSPPILFLDTLSAFVITCIESFEAPGSDVLARHVGSKVFLQALYPRLRRSEERRRLVGLGGADREPICERLVPLTDVYL